MFSMKKTEVPFIRDMKTTAAGGVMVIDAVRSMPSRAACNAVYTALADKRDLSAEDLETLSNRIGRLAWERGRV
jgi:hypothetical protein